VLENEEDDMSWDNMHQELSYQRIADLRADADRYRQVQLSKRRRRSRGRLGRLLWPRDVAARANDTLGQIFSPPWPSRRDTMGPTRLYRPSLGR
jgi:hypothetical protein